jgi:hypothetical protein
MFLTPPFNNDIHLGYLLGGVGRENPASAHVLRKTGFRVVPELSHAETEMFGITLN